jgi:subtilisin-like proprotein convertase family protein
VVADLSRNDTGKLERWGLRLNLSPDSSVKLTSNESLTIPDNNRQGITSRLTVQSSGTLRRMEASVDISHPWIGDLSVSLVSPAGAEVLLHNRTGNGTDNIRKLYDMHNSPALAALVRSRPQVLGEWALKVADLGQGHAGKLNSWGLNIETV